MPSALSDLGHDLLMTLDFQASFSRLQANTSKMSVKHVTVSIFLTKQLRMKCSLTHALKVRQTLNSRYEIFFLKKNNRTLDKKQYFTK